MIKKSKTTKENSLKIDLNLVEKKVKENGHLFIRKKEDKSSASAQEPAFKFAAFKPITLTSQPATAPSSKPEQSEPSGKTKADEKKSPDKKANENKADVSEGEGTLEQHVNDFSVGFEPSSKEDTSPIIKKRKDEPVRDMEQFLEQVPSPSSRKKDEDKGNLYESIDENYQRSYESNYTGRKWDEDRVEQEIKENLVQFEHPRFRTIGPIEDPGLRHNRNNSGAVKYDLQIIDRADREDVIFRQELDKKYKSRRKL